MPNRTRGHAELQAKLAVQLRQLTNRCNAYYEDGEFFEAYSAATIIRVLVHDTRTSTSLLQQLGIKASTPFLDSRFHSNLYVMGFANGYAGLHPRTRIPYNEYSQKNLFPFDEWWENQEFRVVGEIFTRKRLVTALANKEGGAHIDATPDTSIDRINRNPSPYVASEGGQDRLLYGAELASMCAIGEEVLFSLTPEPDNRRRMLLPD